MASHKSIDGESEGSRFSDAGLVGGDLLEVDGLTVTAASIPLLGPKRSELISNVSFAVPKGAALGLVGASGAGKSTLAKAIIGLLPTRSGSVLFDGIDILSVNRRRRRELRKRMQLVLQNVSSLNERHRVENILAEPLHNYGYSKDKIAAKVEAVLVEVDLDPSFLGRYPSQLSGGQKQRVLIGRSLVLNPELLILDEPVAALDRVVQLSILDRLRERRESAGISYLLISHDRAVASYLCDDVLEMVDGKLTTPVESVSIVAHRQDD